MSTVFIREGSLVRVTDKLDSNFLGMEGRVIQVDELSRTRYFLVEFILHLDTDKEKAMDCWFEEREISEV